MSADRTAPTGMIPVLCIHFWRQIFSSGFRWWRKIQSLYSKRVLQKFRSYLQKWLHPCMFYHQIVDFPLPLICSIKDFLKIIHKSINFFHSFQDYFHVYQGIRKFIRYLHPFSAGFSSYDPECFLCIWCPLHQVSNMLSLDQIYMFLLNNFFLQIQKRAQISVCAG